MAPRRWRTDAADPLPALRPPRRDRVPVRRAGRRGLPRRSRGAERPRVEPVPVLPRQPEGPAGGTLGASARLPALVHGGARHGQPRAGPAAVRRLPSGGLIDRSTELVLRWGGRELSGHPGDTLASALLAAGIDAVATSTVHGRPRGVFAAGDEEPNAFVPLEAPREEP